jgi:hypothetical protein
MNFQDPDTFMPKRPKGSRPNTRSLNSLSQNLGDHRHVTPEIVPSERTNLTDSCIYVTSVKLCTGLDIYVVVPEFYLNDGFKDMLWRSSQKELKKCISVPKYVPFLIVNWRKYLPRYK